MSGEGGAKGTSLYVSLLEVAPGTWEHTGNFVNAWNISRLFWGNRESFVTSPAPRVAEIRTYPATRARHPTPLAKLKSAGTSGAGSRPLHSTDSQKGVSSRALAARWAPRLPARESSSKSQPRQSTASKLALKVDLIGIPAPAADHRPPMPGDPAGCPPRWSLQTLASQEGVGDRALVAG